MTQRGVSQTRYTLRRITANIICDRGGGDNSARTAAEQVIETFRELTLCRYVLGKDTLR